MKLKLPSEEFLLNNGVRWKLTKKLKRGANRQWLAFCVCKCGTEKWVWIGNIRTLKSKQCNKCTGVEHGDASEKAEFRKLHRVWIGMRSRCSNKKLKGYKDYGGRGISVCKEWESYNSFKAWALGNGYAEGLSIDRINNNGNYKPSNCRWTDFKTQSRNTRRNIWINKTVLHDLAMELGVSAAPIKKRLKAGWTEEEIRKNPIRKKLYGLPKGVTKRPNGKYRARIGASGKVSLGDFNSIKEALDAIKTAK